MERQLLLLFFEESDDEQLVDGPWRALSDAETVEAVDIDDADDDDELFEDEFHWLKCSTSCKLFGRREHEPVSGRKRQSKHDKNSAMLPIR